MTDNRTNEPNKYAGFLARQNHQRDPWRGIGAKCLCGKVFDLVADHAMHQVDEILRAALVAAQGAAPVPSSGIDVDKLAEVIGKARTTSVRDSDGVKSVVMESNEQIARAVAEWLHSNPTKSA